MLDVNVMALSVCTAEAIAQMQAADKGGHIVHISSLAGYRIPKEGGFYGATKHAVRALTEGLRRELQEQASPIRVSAISPGFVETEFAAVYSGDPAAAAATYSRFRVLDDTDIADALIYLLGAPAHVQVHDLLLRPTEQPS